LRDLKDRSGQSTNRPSHSPIHGSRLSTPPNDRTRRSRAHRNPGVSHRQARTWRLPCSSKRQTPSTTSCPPWLSTWLAARTTRAETQVSPRGAC